MFLKNQFTPDDLLIKARSVADGSQQGEHLYDIISCTTVTLQVVFLVLNISTYYKCRLIKNVDIKNAFLYVCLDCDMAHRGLVSRFYTK